MGAAVFSGCFFGTTAMESGRVELGSWKAELAFVHMRVPTVNSLPRILGPKELTRSAIAEAADASAFLPRTRDEKGRKLWLTDHNDICENCLGTGNMLLCSYCNTAWHLHCTAEAFSKAPTGYWMCSMCVEACRVCVKFM